MSSGIDHEAHEEVMSVLPRLETQNDQMIALLHEQNELLRKRLRVV